jgi:2-polyprenyl-6-methoxyphenol hydroxylase-like FAD-dependent oxidoreductase
MEKTGLRDLKKIFKNYHPPVAEILENTPEQAIIWNDLMGIKPMPSYTNGRVVLLGDAAHAPTPNMGQGGCQALEDAAVLPALLRRYDYKTAFSEFNHLRIPRTHKIINQSWTMGKIAQWENPLAVAFRKVLFRSIPDSINKRQLQNLFDVKFEKVLNVLSENHMNTI